MHVHTMAQVSMLHIRVPHVFQSLDAMVNPKGALPPPPVRRPRIIQMKPRDRAESKNSSLSSTAAADPPATRANDPPTPLSRPTPRTRPPTGAAAASAGGGGGSGSNPKKTARKTAHSIIERRRRSKMNEEFETLRQLVPACRGQAMHKLAILQAGIDYVRYLEACVADLQAVRGGGRRGAGPPAPPSARSACSGSGSSDGLPRSGPATPRPQSPASTSPAATSAAGSPSMASDEDEDVAMEGLDEPTSPSDAAVAVASSVGSGSATGPASDAPSRPSRPPSTWASPVLSPLHGQKPLPSLSPYQYYPPTTTSSTTLPPLATAVAWPATSRTAASTSAAASAWSSPSFGVRPDGQVAGGQDQPYSPLTPATEHAEGIRSPMGAGGQGPSAASAAAADQEATAALLMLNRDRRASQGARVGLSVRDLLSS